MVAIMATPPAVGGPKAPKVETPKKQHPGMAAMADFMKLTREQQAKHGENERNHAKHKHVKAFRPETQTEDWNKKP
jgi:hypothetical protein